MKIRRVVTGFDQQGKAVVNSDEIIDDSMFVPVAGMTVGLLWAYDDKVGFSVPNALDGLEPHQVKSDNLLMKWSTADLPPGGKLAAHSTRTIDVITMLEGEVTLILDTGVEIVLKAHDALLQRGVVHTWENRSSRPAVWNLMTLGRLQD
jgi:hypothetical protein